MVAEPKRYVSVGARSQGVRSGHLGSRSEDRVQGQPLLGDLGDYAGDGRDVFGFTDVVGREAVVVVHRTAVGSKNLFCTFVFARTQQIFD